MKILVVDDNNQKISKVIAHLISIEVLRDDIEIVGSAHEARRFLKQKQIDILILDVLLPLRIEEAPSYTNAINLLEEVCDVGGYYKPSYIIGLTAFSDIAEKVQLEFASRSWTVIEFSNVADSWKEPIENCVRYVRAKSLERSVSNYETDLCILTALPRIELPAITRLPWNWSAQQPLDDVHFFSRGTYRSGGEPRSAIVSWLPRMGMVSAALASAKLIDLFKPRFFVLAGICAGIRGKVNLGDVILGDPCWDWQSGKQRSADGENEGGLHIGAHHISVSSLIRTRMQQLSMDSGLLDRIRGGWQTSTSTVLRLHVGPLVSGSSVMADSEMVERIIVQHRDLLGIEMESYGVYAAGEVARKPAPQVFALKGVCDFADSHKNDEFQPYAAYASASLIREFFERYTGELVGTES